MPPYVLLVDDDPSMIELLRLTLNQFDVATDSASSGEEAIQKVKDSPPLAMVLDILLPEISGKDVLRWMRENRPTIPVVMLTSQDRVDDVVDCMRLGAVDYVQKPFDRTRLLTAIKNALAQGRLTARVETLSRELNDRSGFHRILGDSTVVRETKALLQKAAASDVTVMLQGGSGTGKEVAARAIHGESSRRIGPFVAINCGAIPSGLIETELFGHEKGAFTGASSARAGRFEEAEGGTIFLDEIGELRADLQVRLLRVLQERRVQRVGGTDEVPFDVRVIAATNRNLKEEVASGGFRGDLYYRLAVFPVRLPPLSERGGDVEILAEAFLNNFSIRHRRSLRGFTNDAMRALRSYPWPGNVRELENVIERGVILEEGDQLSLDSLPDELVFAIEESHEAERDDTESKEQAAAIDEVRTLADEEHAIILRALGITNWNLREAARRLGIGRATIYRKMERYGIERRTAQ